MEMEKEMSESDDVGIDIPSKLLVNDNDGIVKEWERCLRGKEITQPLQRHRRIDKLPPLLIKGEKGRRNQQYYEPAVVSLGPYHHDRPDLAQAEKYKLITLKEFSFSIGRKIDYLYNKVFEVVHEARKCYIDGSTDRFSDADFNRMMLRDACFVLFFIECTSLATKKILLNNEYLGAFGFANVVSDIFLLENQIPFVVLEVLLDLRFDDKGEQILNEFFIYLTYGEVNWIDDQKVLDKDDQKPLHLLELYRSHFIRLSISFGFSSSIPGRWRGRTKKTDAAEDYNYVKRVNRSLVSVMELKAKGIFVKRSDDKSNEDIKFHSRCCYGELELVRRAVTPNSKAIYLNMIAYEMCPHNPNDFRVSTYIGVMKSLIVHADDVKELRNGGILVHTLGRDEEVVKMYDEIVVPATNLYMYQLGQGIEKHCTNKYNMWAAELITVYFSSPWKTVALLVASAILFASFLQTYFTIRPISK
ncbi:hypothetical protein OSB04_020611 [Centaurea solstitialis]|uniref:Uncharacterized protein n=1 Tax=Centaurea solstitialis TaxID=347529 RepID=A0AA38ST04_9ASTR|nr:hypothetical protein OSB04_020611 [Centaurea solstitialis]